MIFRDLQDDFSVSELIDRVFGFTKAIGFNTILGFGIGWYAVLK